MGILDRRVLRATVVAASLLGACYEFVGPVPAPTPELLLTGAWAYELTGVPGGGFADSISMVAVGGRVSGAGREYSFGRVYPFTIAGSYSDTTWFFNLTFSFEIGLTDIYTGRVYGADSLYGGIASSPSWDSAPQVFYRQPVPPCTNPAIRFPPPPFAPIAIVQFRDSVDAPAQAALLADRYGFVVSSVFQSGSDGFSAPMSAATASVLLCEPSVASVQYDWPSVAR